MLLWGSSAPYWVESFRGLQSLLALQLPSAGRSAFLLPPREPVGPAELCVKGLHRSFLEPVLLAVVAYRQPGR